MDDICPLLALAGDGRSVVEGVDSGHRCTAEDPPAPLERAMQAQLCLTPAHARCERFLGFVARSRAADPGRSAMADGLVSTRMVLAPEPAWRGIAGRAREARPAPMIAVGTVAVAIALGAAAVAGGMLGGPRQGTAEAGETPSPRPTLEPTRRPTPSPTATESPTPTPLPTPTPIPVTPAPTVVPTPLPTPPPQQTYTVQQGDTLAAIAQRFGTTTQLLQQANGIEDPDQIFIGQVLVIP